MHHRVLVVDDSNAAADTVVSLLTLLGYEARPAYDGRSALDLVDSFKPDTVLLDLMMPLMDGFEVARELRYRADPQLRVIALSGHEHALQQTVGADFDALMYKPATAEQLVSQLTVMRTN